MTLEKLVALAKQHNLPINTDRVTTGTRAAGFRTFEIGTGRPLDTLQAFASELRTQWTHTPGFVTVTVVTNPEHAEHGSHYVEVQLFWAEEN